MIESSWLRAFASFAEDTNLSRAAVRLHLSQPAVHAQVRRLSEALGVVLYKRSGRGLTLTAEGIEVAAFAREAEERARELAARLRGEEEGRRVVLAAGAGSLLYVIGDSLRRFTRRRAVRIDLLTLDAPSTFDAVRSGEAHVGVAAAEVPPADLAIHPIAHVEHVLALPEEHPLAKRRTVKLRDLEGERFVVPPEGRPHRRVLDAAFRAHGVSMAVGAHATGWELSLRLVELGFGLTIVNGCCRIPKGLVVKPLRELPGIRYVACTRARPTELASDLVRTLATR